MKKTLKFLLKVEIEIDGRQPSDEILYDRLINAMNDCFPNMVFDDEELDCAVFVREWCYEKLKVKA